MQLHTHIISEQSPQLLKSLKYAFDHPFSIHSPSKALLESSPSLSLQSMNFCLGSQNSACCILAYNISLHWSTLYEVLATTEGDWEVEIASYDSKSMQVTHEAVFKRDSPEVSFQLEAESTYSIQIQRELRAPVRIYFLPNSVRNSCSPLTPSVHTIFKLLHLLECYFSLDKQPEEEALFQDPLAARLNDYLYTQKVATVQLLLRVADTDQERIIQQVGRLTIPHAWIEKQQYRQIKRDIYSLCKTHSLLLRDLKQAKNEVVTFVNGLTSLVGLPPFKYQQVSVDSLKRLKGEGFSAKAAEVNDLQSALKAVHLRRNQLVLRREELSRQKQQLQNQQISELLKLKNEVLQLQTNSSKGFKGTSQEHIYQRERVSPQSQLITTIFTRAQKKGGVETNQTAPNDLRKSELKALRPALPVKKEKKVTAVEGGDRSELNLCRVQGEREEALLAVDFEVEKDLSTKLMNFQQATVSLAKLIAIAEDLNFLQDKQ